MCPDFKLGFLVGRRPQRTSLSRKHRPSATFYSAINMVKMPTLYPILFLIATANSAPKQSNNELQRPILDDSKPDFPSNDKGVEATRTLMTMTIMRWMMNIFKAMVKPARDMYLTLTPEISAVRCLSESREVQSMFGYNYDGVDDNFEGYNYETPRSPTLGEDRVLKRTPRFIDEVASLLKDGGTMSCVVPYMRERVVRWLDG